jgi:hypothetical protein
MQIITRFSEVGKYQLLKYVGCSIWQVVIIFIDDSEAVKYSIDNNIKIK